MLQVSAPSVYKYINSEKNPSIPETSEENIPQKIEPYQKIIGERIKNGVLNSQKIFTELELQGYKGSYSLLNKYLKEKKDEKITEKIRSFQKIETLPGEQGQVDWGHFGKIEVKGDKIDLYAFVYVLSYSRAMYAEFTTSQRQQVWQDCHMNAFEKLGVPKKLRYDNVKTVVISRHKLQDGKEKFNYNFDFLNFARYYKFEPEVCPPYYPQAKGKVEAGVKYLRNNFMAGHISNKTFKSLDDINEQLRKWLDSSANNRIHSTTREKPKELWSKERAHLFVPDKTFPRYRHSCIQSRYSSQNSMVTYKRSTYWVPQEFARKKIDIEEDVINGATILIFYFKGQKIIEHVQSKPGGWILPADYKMNGGRRSREGEIKAKKLYEIKVEKRDINYYNLLP